MKKTLMVAVLVGAASTGIPQAAEPKPPAAAPERMNLLIPLPLWERLRASARAWPIPLGYSAEDMGHFARHTGLLPTVLRLFRDVRTVPRFTGQLSQSLLDDAQKVRDFGFGWQEGGLAELARRCFALLEVHAGLRTMPQVDSLPPGPFPGEGQPPWDALPPAIQDLVRRLYAAVEATQPWVEAAYARCALRAHAGEAYDPYSLLLALRDDEYLGQLCTFRHEAFALLDQVDLAYLAYASVLFLRHVEFALRAWHEAHAHLECPSVETFRIPTPRGTILIGGTGDDTHEGHAAIVVDLGGNDLYRGSFGAARWPASPLSICVDLGGDDRYQDPPQDTGGQARGLSYGVGLGGVGVALDLGGNDTWEVGESSLGCGWLGVGMLVDYSGDDRFFAERFALGAGHCGVGIMLDLAGDDSYSCAQLSEGLGGPKGVGLLLDLEGDDRYEARDDGNVSALYEGQSVAMSQGCGFGRRADLGDGHSLAGGFGILVDGAGDDDYHAQVWAQGCGYWWGVGILEDRSGNDRYRNGKYSSGAAAHFAIGVHVDLQGNDLYNQGNDTAKNQYQGHARDGGIGVFIDGSGDDRYLFMSHCAGSADLASIALFWDRAGNDVYTFRAAFRDSSPWAQTPPMGSTTSYEPFHSFRDDLPVVGIFLDTQGRDTYETGGRGGNGMTWRMHRNDNAWGVGMDCEYVRQ